ncbi:unnamed protein product [Tilletia controversa]|nr:unnamed protein product [Tilletia controversa]
MLSNSRNIPEIAFKTMGCKLKADKAGDIMGSLPGGRGITFKDAVHIPGVGVNVLSEELLMERGWRKVIRDNGDAILQHNIKPEWRLPLHKIGRARYLVLKLKSVSPVKSEASKNVLAAAQPTADRIKSDRACPKAWEPSPRAEETDPYEFIRVEDFLEPDNDDELPAGEGQREQPRKVMCTGDRPIREPPCRADRDQHSEGERQNFVMFIQESEGPLLPISPTDKVPSTYRRLLHDLSLIDKNASITWTGISIPLSRPAPSKKSPFQREQTLCPQMHVFKTVTDIDKVSSVLGIAVRRMKDAYYINQYVYSPTADILTKTVSGSTLCKHRESMGLQPPPDSTSH